MDIRDSQRIKQICDNTEKMVDAFTRIADALERLTEPKKSEIPTSSEKPNNCVPNYCATCNHKDTPFEELPCYQCEKYIEYESKTDSQTDYERGRQDAWDIAQKVFDSTVTLYEAEDVAKQIVKTEPQTDDLIEQADALIEFEKELLKIEPKPRKESE